MAQSLDKIIIHVVFSTKGGKKLLPDQNIRNELYRYIAGLCRNHKHPALNVGGTADHIHALIRISRSQTAADAVRDIKRSTSHWIKKKDGRYKSFAWQAGYGVFSVSQSKVAEVRKYIADQEKHHRKMSFKEEFRKLLKRHNIEFDEKYVWD